jgi:hypothetical protein
MTLLSAVITWETTMKFRAWCQEKWYEHKEEYLVIGQALPEEDMAQYFNKYKYWLKREYKFQRNQDV